MSGQPNERPLFRAFEQLADAPDGVAKMRELILQLAVQGRLVEQRDAEQGDNTWRAFLDELDARIYGYDPGPPPPFEVPESWRWVCLDDLGDTKPRNSVADDSPASFVPMTLISAKYGAPVRHEPRSWGEIKKGYTHVADGDVVLAKITPCFENGKSAVMRNLVNGVGAGTTELHVFRRGSPVVIPDFVLLFLKSPGFIARGELRMTGSAGQKRVAHDYFAGSPFPLPPPAEQARIVAKVDELMALCDALEARQTTRSEARRRLHAATLRHVTAARSPSELATHWSRLRTHFDPLHATSDSIPALRQTIVTLAVRGKLVPQNPDEEASEHTLAKVLRDRDRQAKSLRIKEPSPVIADAEHTPPLPRGWCYASPDQMTAFHKNALTIGPFGSSLLKSDYADAGVPLIFVRDIRSESFGGPETRFVSAEKADELASHTAKSGDLLITKMGDPPGDTAIYPEGRPPAIITADCIKLTPHRDLVSAGFLRFAIRAAPIAEQFAGITLGVAQQKVSLGRFRCIAVPIPPLAEQKRIVAKVEQLLALCDGLETRLKDADARRERLLTAAIDDVLFSAEKN